MINRFALSFLCIELDRDKTCGVTLVYILLSSVGKTSSFSFCQDDMYAKVQTTVYHNKF